MKNIVFIIFVISLITGCSTFNEMFPDRSDDYQRAESLPDLEIPPDLTAGTTNNAMSIPGESERAIGSTPEITEAPKQASIQSINNNKPLLSIPDEYTIVWGEVEGILQDSGVGINEKDQANGIFIITYSPDSSQNNEGWLSSLAFWKRTGSQSYQLSLTGVADKTELIVLDMDSRWLANQDADILLTTIRDHYNLSRNQ